MGLASCQLWTQASFVNFWSQVSSGIIQTDKPVSISPVAPLSSPLPFGKTLHLGRREVRLQAVDSQLSLTSLGQTARLAAMQDSRLKPKLSRAGQPTKLGVRKKREILSFLVLFPSWLPHWKSIVWSIVGFELCTTCWSFSDRNLWCLGFRHSNVSGQLWELSQPSWVTSYSHDSLCNSRREV